MCVDRLARDTELHRRTRSTHSCFLLLDGKIIFECEDISRHNTIDKAIGWALLKGINLSRTAVFTSGRVPVDMAGKIIRAGVRVLISKETATKEAIELAERFNLTLIGKVRPEGYIVYVP